MREISITPLLLVILEHGQRVELMVIRKLRGHFRTRKSESLLEDDIKVYVADGNQMIIDDMDREFLIVSF